MRAARLHGYGGPEVFRLEELPPPKCGPRDALIEVHAASVNPIDCKIRSGCHRAIIPYRLPVVLGLDFSGVVLEVGRKVTRFAPGDAVYASPTHRRQGSYAETIAVDERALAHKPPGLSHEEAASIPLVGLTVWQSFRAMGGVGAGDRLFVHAGAGGIGSFAIQLASSLGAEVSTSCSGRNLELVRALGARHVANYEVERYEDVLEPQDLALNSMSGEHLGRVLRLVRPGGRMALLEPGIAAAAAESGPYIGALRIGLRMLGFAGYSLLSRRVRSHWVTRRSSGADLEEIGALLRRGAVKPVLDSVYPLEELAAAHRRSESGRARGKIVIAIRP